MGDFQSDFEIDDTINILLIEQIKERPSLYYTDTYSALDEQLWDEIQKNIGIQKSWLKTRWKKIRNDHRKRVLYNHVHRNKLTLHKLADYMDFIHIDLNGAKNINFDDLKQPKVETFCVTQEMIDNCDINESITADSLSLPKSLEIEPIIFSSSEIFTEEPTNEDKITTSNDNKLIVTLSENSNETDSNSNRRERCEDTIFGEWVAATLKKMTPEDKKRTKKEIMSILLQ